MFNQELKINDINFVLIKLTKKNKSAIDEVF